MPSKPAVYFVATEFGEVHHGPAMYTRALWDSFHDSQEIDFHLVVLSSNIEHPRIHVPPQESGKRQGFYRRMAQHVRNSVPRAQANVLLHVNSAHLISSQIAQDYRTIVQINDTEVCQHNFSIAKLKQSGLRRMVALTWRKSRERAVAAKSELVVCNSDFTTQMVREQYGLPDPQVIRIYKAVPLANFLRQTPNSSGSESMNLVFIGNNWQRKGLSVLVEAVGYLRRKYPKLAIKLDVYGKPANEVPKHFRELVNSQSVDQHVNFAGVLSRDDAPRILSNSDLLILPSFEEALGLVTIEAIATGIPVIGSRVGGIPEVINHPDLGTLVPPGDVNRLADAIKLRYDTNMSEREINARKNSSKRFGVENLHHNLASLYDRLFQTKSAS